MIIQSMFKNHGSTSVALYLAIMICSLSISQCVQQAHMVNAEPDTNPVRISTDKTIAILPLAIALNEGLLKQSEIHYVLNFFPTSSQVTQSMVSGQADLGGPISTIDLAIIESKNPGKFKIFSLLDDNTTKQKNSAILVKTDSPYKSMQDLRGKKLAIGPGALFSFLSKNLALKYFNNTNGIQYVIVPPGSWVSALQTGAVDAVFSVEPYTTIALENGGARILLSGAQASVIDPIPVVGYAFTTDFVNNNPQEAAKIVKAIDQAISIAKNDLLKRSNAMVAYLGIPENIAHKVTSLSLENSTQLGIIKPQFQKLADLLFQQGYMGSKIDVTNMLYVK